MNWNLYAARVNASGVRGNERIIGREREIILRKFMSSPALKTVSINGEDIYLLVHAGDVPSEKNFNTLPGEIVNIGDIVLWQKMHWLITQVDFDDDISRRGRMVQCNRQIRWQNPRTYEIIERWCLVTKPYTSNIVSGMSVSTSNREFQVQLPFDTETRLIDLNRRFMLDVIDGNARTYSCISVDQQTNKYQDIDGGFIVINLLQDLAGHSDDRVDLLICDYKKPPEKEQPMSLNCRIVGQNRVRVGVPRSYAAVFYDEHGVPLTSPPTPVWNVNIPSGYENYVQVEQNGQDIKLSVIDTNMVGQEISLHLADSGGIYKPDSIQIEVVSVYG